MARWFGALAPQQATLRYAEPLRQLISYAGSATDTRSAGGNHGDVLVSDWLAHCGSRLRRNGQACGVLVVLFGAAVLAAACSYAQGTGTVAVNAGVAVIALQVGYVGGLAARAAIRSLLQRRSSPRDRAVRAPIGERRH